MSKEISKAVRFSSEEWEKIGKFLEQNPFFDFSKLVRIAVAQYMQSPYLKVKPSAAEERHIRKTRIRKTAERNLSP